MKPAILFLTLVSAGSLWAAKGAPASRDPLAASPADWPMYNHDPAGWRFNPAEKTLGAGNVGTLVGKWRFPDARSGETIGVVHATPTGGRVTATSADLATERWRHERPKIAEMGGTPGKPMYRDVGDVVASGVAVGNGVAYFTAVGSGKLVALDAANGSVLKEIDLGPVFAGPSLSRGRVYVGSGNTLWTPSEFECFFPKKYTGSVRCFGLPGEDELDTLGKAEQ